MTFLGAMRDEPPFPLSVETVSRKLRVIYIDIDPANPPPRERGPGYVIDAGRRAYPALLQILTKKGYSDRERASAIGVLLKQKNDRSMFADAAASLLDAESRDLRTQCLKLLAEIGTADHVEKVLPLLKDDDVRINSDALDTIVALGDVRHAAKLEAFLNEPEAPKRGKYLYQLEATIDALKAKPAPKGRK